MRAFRPTLFSLFLATSLAAQTPTRQGAPTPPAAVTPRQTLSFDVAALVDDRARVGLEPLVFGRWTIGLGASYTRTAPEEGFPYPVPLRDFGQRDVVTETTGPTVVVIQRPPCILGYPCPDTYPFERPKYRAWSLDLSARYYPPALSFSGPQQRLMVYVGEFIGYHRRRVEQNLIYYYGCPYCESPPPLPPDSLLTPPPDSGYYPPIYIPPPVSRFTQNLRGWEPGVEIGVRLIPASPVFIDVGGWFKLVTVDDPMQRIRPGDVDSRLVVAVGIGW